jgi:N-dimethylarginine dimethylaminohydrolase
MEWEWNEDSGWYQCECGFGSRTGASAQDLINHVRGCHCIDVTTGYSHFAYCNDCPRQNGHGRRLNNMDAVMNHLEKHGVEIYTFDYN